MYYCLHIITRFICIICYFIMSYSVLYFQHYDSKCLLQTQIFCSCALILRFHRSCALHRCIHIFFCNIPSFGSRQICWIMIHSPSQISAWLMQTSGASLDVMSGDFSVYSYDNFSVPKKKLENRLSVGEFSEWSFLVRFKLDICVGNDQSHAIRYKCWLENLDQERGCICCDLSLD